MTNQNEKKSSGSIGIPTVLFIVFLVLKLVGVISWSWWWVTAPLWIPFALAVILVFIIGTARMIIRKKKMRKHRDFRKSLSN
jgi:membrane protein YdbS with pleckstrin-like domain